MITNKEKIPEREMITDEEIIQRAMEYVADILKADSSGHGGDHAMRVYRIACRIAEGEQADPMKVKLAALLHDVDDIKLFPETAGEKRHAVTFLREMGYDDCFIGEICGIIEQVSYVGTDSVIPVTMEGRCVQDADRLDALGAIGIARTFTFGGAHGRVLYDPDIPPCLNMTKEEYRSHISTTINHFYEKLLLLKDMMTTETGRAMAEHRHLFLEEFLQEFLDEWEGIR